MQAKRAGNIAGEAGNTDAHVARVAEFNEDWREDADHHAGNDGSPSGNKKFGNLLHNRVPFKLTK